MKNEINVYLRIFGIFCMFWIASVFTFNTYWMTTRTTTAVVYNTKLIFAVCRRFNNDELLDLQTTHTLAGAFKNPVAKAALSQNYARKEKQLKNECSRAMNRAETEFVVRK